MKTIEKRLLALLLAVLLVYAGMPAFADTVATVCASTAEVYDSPYFTSAKKLYTLRKGDQVTVRAVSKDVAKVRINERTGYMDATKLTIGGEEEPEPEPIPDDLYQIAVPKLTIFKKAAKTAGTYGVFPQGTKVTLLATKGEWAAVRLMSGEIGYCAFAGLEHATAPVQTPAPAPTTEPTPVPAYPVNKPGLCVTTERLAMYKKPSTSADSYGTFAVGIQVQVTALSGDWAKISYGGKTGYVLRKGLKPYEEGGEEDDRIYTHKAVRTAKLYSKPSTSSTCVRKVSAGTFVKVTAKAGAWLKIRIDEVNYYGLSEDFIESEYSSDAMVVVESLNIHASASDTSRVVGTCAEGTMLQILATSGDWGRITYNGERAFVSLDGVVFNPAHYTTLSKGSNGEQVRAMQKRLEALGYMDASPSGDYGSMTETCVKRFQQKRGLAITGIANEPTQAALFAMSAPTSDVLTRTLSEGDTGNYVKRLQSRLFYKSYYTTDITGTFDSATKSAVLRFQKQTGLTQSGKADLNTLKLLYSNAAPICTTRETPPGSHGTPTLDPPNCCSDNEDIETVVLWAIAQLGKPYVYGTSGPNSFDCSGLTYFCFKKVGITLPRSAYDVGYAASLGERIAYEDLKRGDICCFNTMDDNDLSDHVGLYLGDGLFIHAPHTGTDVSIVSLKTGYYQRNFSWARRAIK